MFLISAIIKTKKQSDVFRRMISEIILLDENDALYEYITANYEGFFVKDEEDYENIFLEGLSDKA